MCKDVEKISREDKKVEALLRMKKLKLHENVLAEFKNEDKLNQSETGVLYWVENEEVLAKIKEFEANYNALVYHVIRSHTSFGELYSFLYVSDHQEEWQSDDDYLKENLAYAYVFNISDDWCSEIGMIQIQPITGGLRRTA